MTTVMQIFALKKNVLEAYKDNILVIFLQV